MFAKLRDGWGLMANLVLLAVVAATGPQTDLSQQRLLVVDITDRSYTSSHPFFSCTLQSILHHNSYMWGSNTLVCYPYLLI
jgi:hypothetical protein